MMTDPRSTPLSVDELPEGHDDATDNAEQADEDSQAQSVADDAIGRATSVLGESEKTPGDRTALMPHDAPDLLDTMEQMVSSGHIDTGAFTGEPDHDDGESPIGSTHDADEEHFGLETHDRAD
jgi:hypothetical protein